MTSLSRHVLRSTWKIRWRLLVIATICAATFGVVAGAYSSIKSLFDTVESIQVAANMADLELIISTEDANNLPDFSDLPGLEAFHQRLLSPGILPLTGGEKPAALLVSAPAADFSQINKLTLLQGRLPRPNERSTVAVERNCAKYHRLAPGDSITYKSGSASYPFEVVGVVQSPEYLVAPFNAAAYVPGNGSLCVLYADIGLMQERLGFAALNSLLFETKPGTDSERFRELALTRAQTRVAVDYALPRQEQFSQKFLELNLNTFKIFLPTVVAIFLLSSTLVVFFLMLQWVREEQTLIAMFLTLGYERKQVLLAYSLPVWLLLLVGLGLGFVFAQFDLRAFGLNYADSVGMPPPHLVLKPPYLLAALLALLTTVLIGIGLPLRNVLQISPMDALREQGNSRESPLALKLVAMTKGLGGPFWFRYAVRSLLRNWRISLITTVAMAASVGITIAFYISMTSIVQTSINNVQHDRWSQVVVLDAPWWDEDMDKLKQAVPDGQWLPFVRGGLQLRTKQSLDNILLLGFDPANAVRELRLTEGRLLKADDNEALVLDSRMAANRGIKVGDTVWLRARAQDYQAQVVGLFSASTPGEALAPIRFAQTMLERADQFTGAWLVEKPGSAPLDIRPLYQVPGVVTVTSKQDIIHAILQMSEHINVIIHISAMTSIFVAILFAITSMSFAITGRSGEYGILRILGFRNRSVGSLIYGETLMLAFAAALLAAPLGFALASLLNQRLASVWFEIDTLPTWYDYLRVLVPALLFIPLAALPAVRKVLRTEPVDTLKQRNFG